MTGRAPQRPAGAAPRPRPARSGDPTAEAAPVVRRRRGARAERTTRQKVLRGLGIGIVLIVLSVGGVLAWGVYKLNSLERVDVALAAAAGDAPLNFLLVGSDTRDLAEDTPDAGSIHGKDAPGGQRADTIVVARVDPASTSVELLSIPRDLWVTRPDGEEGRINAAYNEGPQALIDTVQQNIGVPINHYVEVNFEGFKGLVDAIGGVPMYFDRPVYDNNSGLRVREKGCYNLDAVQALAYARSRHLYYSNGTRWVADPTGDMGRVTRQQIFLRRAMAKISTLGIGDLNTMRRLVDVGVDTVKVDSSLSVDALMGLGRKFRAFDSSSMVTHRLPTTDHTTDGGAAVLLLDEANAAHVLDVFAGKKEPDAADTEADADDTPVVPPSSVTVDVLNGAGTNGLATRVSGELGEAGFATGEVGDAPKASKTELRHATGERALAELVAEGLSPAPTVVEDRTVVAGHVEVTLGRDFSAVTAAAASSASTSTPAAGATTAPTTTIPVSDQEIGYVVGDPPPGVTCG